MADPKTCPDCGRRSAPLVQSVDYRHEDLCSASGGHGCLRAQLSQRTAERDEARRETNYQQAAIDRLQRDHEQWRVASERRKIDRIEALEKIRQEQGDRINALALALDGDPAALVANFKRDTDELQARVNELRADLRRAGDERDEARTKLAAAVRATSVVRDFAAYWLLCARDAWQREGWEDGPSTEELHAAIVDVLFNLGCDEGTGDSEHVAEVARLRALPARHDLTGALRDYPALTPPAGKGESHG